MGFLVTTLVQLLMVPILTSAWGLSDFGTWVVLMTIPTFAVLPSVAMTMVTANEIALLSPRAGKDEVAALAAAAMRIIVVVSALMIIAAAVLAGLGGNGVAVTLMIFAVASSWRAVSQLGFRASGRYATGVTCDAAARALDFGALAIAGIAGGSMQQGALVMTVAAGATASAMLAFNWATVPWLRCAWRRRAWDIGVFRRVVSLTIHYLAFPLALNLRLAGVLAGIGAVLGPAAAGVFAVHRTYTRIVLQPASALSASSTPEMALAFGAGDPERARWLRDRGHFLALTSALVGAGALILAAPIVFEWWASSEPSMVLVGIMLASAILQSGYLPHGSFLRARNEIRMLAAIELGLSVLVTAVPLLWGVLELTSLSALVGMIVIFDAVLYGVAVRRARRVDRRLSVPVAIEDDPA